MKGSLRPLFVGPTLPHTFEYGEIRGMDWPEGDMIHGEHLTRYGGGPLRVGGEVCCYAGLKDFYEKEGRGGPLHS